MTFVSRESIKPFLSITVSLLQLSLFSFVVASNINGCCFSTIVASCSNWWYHCGMVVLLWPIVVISGTRVADCGMVVPLWPIVVWAVAAAKLIQGSFWYPAVDQTVALLGARQSTLLMSSFLLPYNVSRTGTWTCDLINFILPPQNLSSRR